MSRLGTVLLNPPLTSGAATRRHVERGAAALGFAEWQIANLFAVPTLTVIEINPIGAASDGWLAARPELTALVATSDALLIGWGVGGLHGETHMALKRQILWLRKVACEFGHVSWWTLGGQPRHPSRWHQYISERHGRANGDCFAERFKSVAKLACITEP